MKVFALYFITWTSKFQTNRTGIFNSLNTDNLMKSMFRNR